VYPEFDNGNRLHCRMSCFGLRWDAETKGYVDSGLPPVPDALRALATWVVGQAAAVDASVLGATTRFDPDLLLANFYTAQGKMGLHQDTSERRETIEAGSPVVSISFGAAADFVFADRRPGEASGLPGAADDGLTRIQLGSGDVLVFGGAARLVYHGVERIVEGRKPTPGLALKPGRLNLTFRMH
jgi:alkylated DNA repair dioxygenase AlkB